MSLIEARNFRSSYKRVLQLNDFPGPVPLVSDFKKEFLFVYFQIGTAFLKLLLVVS
jgi:hypothetical protein